jgi:hypothetical protein
MQKLIKYMECLKKLLEDRELMEEIRAQPEVRENVTHLLVDILVRIGVPLPAVEIREPVALTDNTIQRLALATAQQLKGTPVTLFKCSEVPSGGAPCTKGLEVHIDGDKLHLKCPDHGKWEIGPARKV